MTRWLRANGWYSLGMVLALLAGALWTPHLYYETLCLFVRVLPADAPGPDRLLACSNIEQSIVPSSLMKVRDIPADAPGWRLFTSSGEAGSLNIRFRKSAGKFVFYPRLGGTSDSITVYEVLGQSRRLLYFERGDAKEWTRIARKRLLCTECVSGGWSAEDVEVEVEVVLEGPGAQLWHKDGIVFF